MTRRERRVLAMGTVILVMGVVLRFGAPTVAFVRQRIETSRERRALVARARALVQSTPTLQAALAARADELLGTAPLLFSGSAASGVAAGLAGRITAAAATNRVRIDRIEPLPDSTVADFTSVELRVRAEGDLAGIIGFLAALERGPQLVTVTQFAITNEHGASDPQRLRLDLSARGWALLRMGG